MKKRIQVRIGNMTYQLVADSDPDKMRDIAATADAMMEQISQKTPGLNQTSTAVLALVNAVSMMQEAYEHTRKAYEDREWAMTSKEEVIAELARLREQFWSMKKDLLYYRNLCDVYEEKLSSFAGSETRSRSRSASGRKKPATELEERQQTLEEWRTGGESDETR